MNEWILLNAYHFFLRFNYSDNQLMPSFIPNPSTALLYYMCHGLSVIRSNCISFATSCSNIAIARSILFAKNSIGTSLILIAIVTINTVVFLHGWSSRTSSSFLATYILSLSAASITNITAYTLHAHNQYGSYFWFIIVFLPDTAIFALPGHVKNSEINLAFGKRLNLKTDSSSNFNLSIL